MNRRVVSFLDKSNKPSYWWLVPLSVLAIALAARIVSSTADPFNWDNYWLMFGVEESFAEYSDIYPFHFPLEVHYWLSYRVFGGSLWGYLVLPVVSSLGTLLVVYWGLRHYWHSNLSIWFFTLLVLAFNFHSISLAQYSMFTYANSLFVSACLYFLFLRLSMGKLTRMQWILITVCAIPAAFFSNIIMLVAIATGICSVLICRLWHKRTSRSLSDLIHSLIEFWPLAIFPLTQLAFVVWNLSPLDAANRPALSSLYFGTSPYPHTIWGVPQFLWNNTVDLVKGLLGPGFVRGSRTAHALWDAVLIVTIVTMSILLIRLIKRKLHPNISFTVVFVVVTYMAIAFGGLLVIMPFGHVRYADYMLIPIAVLIGYVCSLVFEWILSKISIKKMRGKVNSKIAPILLAIIILISGTFINVREYRANSDVKSQNYSALQEIENNYADLVLYSIFSAPVLRAKCTELYENAYSMGFGMTSGRTSDGGIPDEIAELIIGSTDTIPLKSVLVITPKADDFVNYYPSWSDFIFSHFNQTSYIESPSIWAGYFYRQ